MKHPILLCGLLAMLAAAVDLRGQAPPDAPNGQRTVLLRNGNVLTGQVDVLGDMCRIDTGTSEIRLPTRDVECVVGSLRGAYETKRQAVRQDSASDHLELAKWCIRQELWQQAADQLRQTRQIDPRHPATESLERRLEVASRAALRASRRQAPPAPATADNESDASQTRQAELESLAASLPEDALQDFARHVQPILVNGCSAAGCHSSDDPRDFRLNRDLLHGLANRESTLRNLEAVWNTIDHQNPEYSPLLTQPAVPHGGLPHPVFAGYRKRAFERLEQWVRDATEQPDFAVPQQVELAAHEGLLGGSTGPMPAGPNPPGALPTGATGPAASPKIETPANLESDLHFWEVEPPADGQTKGGTQRGAQPNRFTPRDEFDPELFNRQTEAAAAER